MQGSLMCISFIVSFETCLLTTSAESFFFWFLPDYHSLTPITISDYNWWQKENIWLEIGVGVTDSSSVITISVYFPRSSTLRTRIRLPTCK
ncbi:hypothetical protein TanjilG_07338 [Lupinus angustifolius]|uniref:Uncharacterized protein n=1 Tax=Lupinus angustifolius TaxID=3871 RepID=A0A4P1R026_LUPAN|nr:hypothetical protein TanjilG_07338 [Lupinus angustifolius]